MDGFPAYSPALVSLAVYAIVGQILSAVAAVNRSRAGFGPGEMPPANYADPAYRACRAYHNTVDNAGTFAGAVAAAVLVGAAPVWTNLAATLAVVARLSFAVIYLRGIGAADGGPRTLVYVFGSGMTILIALLAVLAGIA